MRLTEGELDELYMPHGGVAAYTRRMHALLSTAFLPAQPPRGAVRFLCARQQPRILRRRAAREKVRLYPSPLPLCVAHAAPGCARARRQ